MHARKSYIILVLFLLSLFFIPVNVSDDGVTSMTSSDIVGNSESLTATDISELPHHRSPVSMLVYTQFADLQTGIHGEYNNTMTSIRDTYVTPQTTFSYENLTDYAELEARLWEYDIFLIPEQEHITQENISDIAVNCHLHDCRL